MVKIAPEKLRALRISLAASGFGLLVFIVALKVWFPYDRAKEVAINLAAAADLDVEIASAGPALGLGVVFKDIRIKTRPLTGKPTRFTIDSARVSVSLLSLLPGASTVIEVALDAFGGHIDFTQQGTPGRKSPFRFAVSARDVNMSDLPGIKEAINLPLAGTLKLDLDVASATGRYATASGAVGFTCAGCVLGDGKTPFKVAGNPFLSGGLTLPKVRLGDLVGEIPIESGTAKFKHLEAKSVDGELALEGEVQLRDPLLNSNINSYLRFKLSDTFLRAASSLQTILQMAAAAGKRPDGGFGMRVTGRLGQLNPPVLAPASPFAGAPTAARAGGRPTPPSSFPPAANQPSITPTPTSTPPPPAPPVVDTPPPPPPPPAAPPAPEPAPTIVSPPPPTPPAPAAPPEPAGAMRGTPPPAPNPVVDEARRYAADAAGAGAAGAGPEEE
jgi:type II secretion system protein N